MEGGVANDAAFSDLPAANFELGFHEDSEFAVRVQQGDGGGKD